MRTHETENAEAAARAFGLAVWKLRRGVGMTEAQLARRLRGDVAAVRSVERGQQAVPLEAVWRYAEALGVPVAELLDAVRRFSG